MSVVLVGLVGFCFWRMIWTCYLTFFSFVFSIFCFFFRFILIGCSEWILRWTSSLDRYQTKHIIYVLSGRNKNSITSFMRLMYHVDKFGESRRFMRSSWSPSWWILEWLILKCACLFFVSIVFYLMVCNHEVICSKSCIYRYIWIINRESHWSWLVMMIHGISIQFKFNIN